MALDYGERRIGAAVCDELAIAAHPLPAIARDGHEMDRIGELVQVRHAEVIVVGLPLRMDGTEGTQARRVRGFAKELGRALPGVKVELMDERLTTAQAHRALSMMDTPSRRRREHVDAMAAQLILERYMGRRRASEGGDG